MTSPRLHVCRSPRTEALRAALTAGRADPALANAALVDIARELFSAMRAEAARAVPVFVLRGGLLMRDAYRDVMGERPFGVVAPLRPVHEQDPDVTYGSVPAGADRYLVADVLTASGRTMTACLAALRDRLGCDEGRLRVVTPFLSGYARDRLLRAHPRLHIHCVWHEERVDETGRMVGPGFDIGEYAFGGPPGGFVSWSRA
jgi:uracil phosphoribosyltransferase